MDTGVYHCTVAGRDGGAPSSQLPNSFDLDCSAIGQHFSDALHDFCGVIAHADYSVRAVLGRVLQHKFKRIFTRLFAKICENSDISANNCLQSRAEIANHAARTHDNPRTTPQFLTIR